MEILVRLQDIPEYFLRCPEETDQDEFDQILQDLKAEPRGFSALRLLDLIANSENILVCMVNATGPHRFWRHVLISLLERIAQKDVVDNMRLRRYFEQARLIVEGEFKGENTKYLIQSLTNVPGADVIAFAIAPFIMEHLYLHGRWVPRIIAEEVAMREHPEGPSTARTETFSKVFDREQAAQIDILRAALTNPEEFIRSKTSVARKFVRLS